MMSVVRIVATGVTGLTMILGGLLLVTAGPPAVVVLGLATVVVGLWQVSVGMLTEGRLSAGSDLAAEDAFDVLLAPQVPEPGAPR